MPRVVFPVSWRPIPGTANVVRLILHTRWPDCPCGPCLAFYRGRRRPRRKVA